MELTRDIARFARSRPVIECAQCGERIYIHAGSERKNLVLAGVLPHYVKRVSSDGAGRTQDGNASHAGVFILRGASRSVPATRWCYLPHFRYCVEVMRDIKRSFKKKLTRISPQRHRGHGNWPELLL